MKRALLLVAVLSTFAAAAAKREASQAPDPEAMTKAWQAFASPNANHEKLAKMAGNWTTKTTFWAAPGAPPQESEGTAELQMILGGRYLEQRHHGSLMGQPFEGLGYTGYDNLKRKYVTTWMDNFGTSILVMTGSLDASGKVLRSQGTMDEIMTGKPQKLKDAVTLVDDDHFTYDLWTADPKGRLAKTMEIAYTRAK